jgi:hypothetical protein
VKYLSTAAIGKLCGCTRVWAFNKARDGFFDEFKLADWHGKHYRFKDSPKLRAQCSAIKADRERARLPRLKAKSRSAGVASFQGIEMQWRLLMGQLGDTWKKWTDRQQEQARAAIAPVIEFDRSLSQRRRFR